MSAPDVYGAQLRAIRVMLISGCARRELAPLGVGSWYLILDTLVGLTWMIIHDVIPPTN